MQTSEANTDVRVPLQVWIRKDMASELKAKAAADEMPVAVFVRNAIKTALRGRPTT